MAVCIRPMPAVLSAPDDSCQLSTIVGAALPGARCSLPTAPLLPPRVQVSFVEVEYRDMSLMGLMTHGLHALPVLQVSHKVRPRRRPALHSPGVLLHMCVICCMSTVMAVATMAYGAAVVLWLLMAAAGVLVLLRRARSTAM
jgi:hypothetical protein